MFQFVHLLHSLLFLYASSAIGLKICAGKLSRKKSIIEKKNKKHDQIVLLGKKKLYAFEVLISKASVDLERIVDRDGIIWLNEKNIEVEFDHANLRNCDQT